MTAERGGAAEWLGYAASPSFAVMALVCATQGSAADMLCGAVLGGTPFSGMTWMYVLMSVFHAAPWVRLASRRAPDKA